MRASIGRSCYFALGRNQKISGAVNGRAPVEMLIDGAWTAAADGAVNQIRNPATGEVIGTAPSAAAADVERAVAAAQAGKTRMAAVPAHERCAILLRVADRIEAEKDELARMLVRENGKTHREIVNEIKAAVRIWRGYAEESKRIFGKAMGLDSVPGRERSLAVTVRRPLGVIVAIVPFNYPVELWSHKAAGALAAGNAASPSRRRNAPLRSCESRNSWKPPACLGAPTRSSLESGRWPEWPGPRKGRANGGDDRQHRRGTPDIEGCGRHVEKSASRARRERRDHRVRRRRSGVGRLRSDLGTVHERQRPDLLRREAGARRRVAVRRTARPAGRQDPDTEGRRPCLGRH